MSEKRARRNRKKSMLKVTCIFEKEMMSLSFLQRIKFSFLFICKKNPAWFVFSSAVKKQYL